MNYVDLHVHSNHSDGTFSPGKLVSYAKEKGLYAFALTDHDTVSGVLEAVKAGAEAGMIVVPGIEFSAIYEGKRYSYCRIVSGRLQFSSSGYHKPLSEKQG